MLCVIIGIALASSPQSEPCSLANAADPQESSDGEYLDLPRRVHRLPHARLLLRQARHGPLSRRLGGRLRDPGLGVFTAPT